jgi:hypothetical protein
MHQAFQITLLRCRDSKESPDRRKLFLPRMNRATVTKNCGGIIRLKPGRRMIILYRTHLFTSPETAFLYRKQSRIVKELLPSVIHHQDAISPHAGMQAAALASLALSPKGRNHQPAEFSNQRAMPEW